MVFPSSVSRTAAGYKSVRIRKVLRPTNRPTDRPSRHRLVFLVGLCVAAHVEMVRTLQVATACFSGSPPHLRPSKLIPNMSKEEESSAQRFIMYVCVCVCVCIYIYIHTHTHTHTHIHIYTIICNVKKPYVMPTQPYLYVLCGSENKQRLFPYTTLTGWFL